MVISGFFFFFLLFQQQGCSFNSKGRGDLLQAEQKLSSEGKINSSPLAESCYRGPYNSLASLNFMPLVGYAEAARQKPTLE